jgi:cytochrome c-type biogenesis protein CcmH
MVCQNQSIDDSEAPLAKDLRLLVRERLTQGDSDKQVLDFLVTRYGEFVLLRPQLQWHTLLLWGLPPAVLLTGMITLLAMARRRKIVATAPAELSDAEQRRLAALVKPGEQL